MPIGAHDEMVGVKEQRDVLRQAAAHERQQATMGQSFVRSSSFHPRYLEKQPCRDTCTMEATNDLLQMPYVLLDTTRIHKHRLQSVDMVKQTG
jgi:hypothetical protein